MTQSMTTNMVDLYPYPIPEDFRTGTMFSGHFITVFIANADKLKLPDNTEKPKYAFSVAIPYENKKTQCREVQSVKFSCSQEDYEFLITIANQLRFQPVHLTCEPDAWASNGNHGLFFKYVSNSLRRFDGKPLVEKKA